MNVLKSKNMNCCVIGIGQFGYTAAIQLVENGVQVCAVDRDISIINKIEDKVSYAVCLEVIDENSLKNIGIDTFDIIILAMGQNFEELIIIAGLLKKKFKIPCIICRASNDQQKIILSMLGIEYIILPEKESALQMVDKISIGYGYFYRISNNYSVSYINAKKSWVGLSINDLKAKLENVTILGKKIENDIESVLSHGLIQIDDILVFSGENKSLFQITKQQ